MILSVSVNVNISCKSDNEFKKIGNVASCIKTIQSEIALMYYHLEAKSKEGCSKERSLQC